ncbi:MAG: OmpH family outer membrane protein [Bacteroidia bacterium]|nr:OmpH family outer membrane protein [Bacteroidia bacterium]
MSRSTRYIIVALVLIIESIVGISAQDYRFAHLNFQSILNDYPAKKDAEAQLYEETQKLKDQLLVMNAELERRYADYIQKRDDLPDLVRNTIEKDLQDTEARITSYREMAMRSITEKEQKLLQPIIDKIMEAIDKVREEHDFTYIFDTSTKVILSYSPLSYDAEPMVRAKLGME